ncbi:MAG TPA: beta-ketoacyl-ACP synthase III [Caldisericia bacterium]|nr:beta-ketoacyl-ACP synthase III [Caldisericia bacterium]HUN19356.1 beta-ketoacyl-ACP synthase III [Caldisericia bacterium]
MINTGILGIGTYLPEKVLTNFDMEKIVDTTDEWIVSRSGIRNRHVVAEGQATSDISLIAAQRALENAGLEAKDIDMFIVATATPDMLFPSTACIVASKLGIVGPPAFDIAAGCTGFVYALTLANSFIKSGIHKRILVIGAESLTRILDWTDRSTCVLFGDGAGAVIVGETERNGIVHSVLGADGSGGHNLTLPAGGSALPASHETVDKRLHYVHMNGPEVFKFAVRAMAKSCKEVLEKAGMTSADINWFVPHQANIRIIESASHKLGIPMEKVLVTLDKTGNTSAATIPITIDMAVKEGKIKKGDKLLAVAFGAGLTWGAVVLEW